MKLKLVNIICLFSMVISFSCSNRYRLEGNYSICQNGEYMEVYFTLDSMRVAANNYWVNLSKWREIKVKNDTLYFETFGEWRDSAQAEISYLKKNKIRLRILSVNDTVNLEPIKENLNINDSIKFWNGFQKRQDISECKQLN